MKIIKILKKAVSLLCAAVLMPLNLSAVSAAGAADISDPGTVFIDFSGAGGWSGTNTWGDILKQIDEPGNPSNKVLSLSPTTNAGFNVELACSGDNNKIPYTLSSNTSYTVSFKYKQAVAKTLTETDKNYPNIALNLGTQSAYDANKPKHALSAVTFNDKTGSDWNTFEYTFTTTANMTYKEYNKNSSLENVVDKLYIVLGNCKGATVYLDDVTIKNNDYKAEKYTVNNFSYEPYIKASRGAGQGDFYVSLRMFSDTITENGTSNSVLGYSYSLDTQSELIGKVNNGSGNRGSAIGTNGDGLSASALVAAGEKPIAITPGKAYKVSFKYKVTKVEGNSYIGFALQRGLYQSGWSGKKSISSAGDYIFALAAEPMTEWNEASYSFLAGYKADDYKYLNIAVRGYGEAYMDDFVIEEINPGAVESLPDVSDYTFKVVDGKAVITEYSGSKKEITLPEKYLGVPAETVGKYAFLYDSKTEKITVPDGYTRIEKSAFENSASLKTITIPKTVTQIGETAFSGCEKLESINVAHENTGYASYDGVLYDKEKTKLLAYPAAKADTSFKVPETVTEILDNAFYGANKLTNITLPTGLKKIGRSTFANCTSLTSVSLPEGVTELGASVFRNCTALSSVRAANTGIKYGENTFFGCEKLYRAGDIYNDNNDGEINIKDSIRLRQHLTGGNTLDYFGQLSADLNRDGKVDEQDVNILNRRLAGWRGYELLPNNGRGAQYSAEYKSSSDDAQLVINLNNKPNNVITSVNRDIGYDESKDNVIIVLVIGQSNSTTNVGYPSENGYKVRNPDYVITADPIRPDGRGKVYSGFYNQAVEALTDKNDMYTMAEPGKGYGTFGGYTPAIGKVLNEKTDAKVVFVQCASGATGMHEWTKHPENYKCSCTNKGGGEMYSQAVKCFTKTYRELSEEYNIISTGYIWNQGEHEEYHNDPEKATIHDAQGYYDAYISMHNDIMKDCELDFGGIVMPRSFFMYNKNYSATEAKNDSEYVKTFDNEQHSRCSTIARDALYRAANDVPNLFVMSNAAETIKYGEDDPNNRIHYAQIAYNKMGSQAGENIARYIDKAETSGFTGITVYNSQGEIIARFDANGKLTEGSKTVTKTDDNISLRIAVEPLGTYYEYELDDINTEFVDKFGKIDWAALKKEGKTSFDIIINPPVK